MLYAGHQGFVRLALEEGAWLVPVLALGETLTPLQLAGAGVTLGAVALINSNQGGSGGKGSGGGRALSVILVAGWQLHFWKGNVSMKL